MGEIAGVVWEGSVVGGDSDWILLVSGAIGVTVVVITSVVTDPGWQFVTAGGHDVMVYVVVDDRVVGGDEVVVEFEKRIELEELVVELLGDVLEEVVDDTVVDAEHPGALVLSVRRSEYPVALRSM